MAHVQQGSPEWIAARLGRVTSSRVADIVTRTKSGYSTSRANYMAQLLSERLTGIAVEGFSNAAMQWGADHEEVARAAYEFQFDQAVELVGFVSHPSIAQTGASPDGFLGASGLIEIKCPNTATHIDTLLSGDIPLKYETQILWQMACTGRDWCDFVSFDPRLPESMALFVKRLHRDDAKIRELEEQVTAFLAELQALVLRLDVACRTSQCAA